jgi:thiosulfate reductase cytochrome b subunit
MSAKHLRQWVRWIHIAGAALIGTFVYSPWRHDSWFVLTMQVAVIPLLTLTGLALWKQAIVNRWLRGGRHFVRD